MVNPAIYSPDTFSYLRAMPERHPGYVVFLKFFSAITPNKWFFDNGIKLIQVLFGSISIFYFYKKITTIFTLSRLESTLLVLVLIFPFLPPIQIANNICPEGISYPLYLLFLGLAMEIIVNNNAKKLHYFLTIYIILALTRGQFIIATLVLLIPLLPFLKSSKVTRSKLKQIAVFLMAPAIVMLLDMSYHKVKDGHFKTTPYGFVNVSGLAFYVSKEENGKALETNEEKTLFSICQQELYRKHLLVSQLTTESYKEKYMFFHNHVPQICNQTIFKSTLEYLTEKQTGNDKKAIDAKAHFEAESLLKKISLSLIIQNFRQWITLYFENIIHGFKSIILLLFMTALFIYSLVSVLFKRNKLNLLLFILLSLTLSNAMLVAFASHSIMRYLFYNYVSMFLIFVLLINEFKTYVRKH